MLFKKVDLLYTLAFVLVLVAFIVIKFGHLDISYFWDECWVYAPAIQYMADAGPSLLPGKVDLYLTRGHPLFFHFLGGAWLSVFGKSFVAAHSFPLFISVLFSGSLYYILQKIWDTKIAFYTTTLFLFQIVFMAQSSMVLPEVLVAALSILSIYSFVVRQWVWYIVWGCLLLLTKETGIIAIMACNSYVALSLVFGKSSLKELLYSLIPYLSFAFFLLVQKIEYGWYLYPEHVSMMEFNPDVIIKKFKSIFNFLVIHQGRAKLFALAIILCLLSYDHVKYSRLTKTQRRFINCFGIFFLGYVIFSCLNFLTFRYLLVLLPLLILAAVVLICCSTEGLKKLDHIVLVSLLLLYVCNFDQRTPARDINLSYLEYCPIQEELVQYLEDQNLYQEYIYADFLNTAPLTEPFAGYRTTSNEFSFVNKWNKQPNQKYVVINSIESAHKKDKLEKDPKAKFLKRFERGGIWLEVYHVTTE